MTEWRQLVSEWLSEYSALQPSEMRSFAAEHEHNHEIASAVYELLSDCVSGNATSKGDSPEKVLQDSQMLENVCTQLFSFYRSKETELQLFALQFLPSLIYAYLSTVAKGDKRTFRCIETLLIGLYNYEVMDENGKAKVVSFRLPSLAQASIYHEPLSLAPQFLTESALRRWEECNTKLVNWGPMQQVEGLNAQNRLKVMTALLFVYNRQLSLLPKMALRDLCISASSLVKQGFSTPNKSDGPTKQATVQRIPVSSHFLLELVQGAYFAMFNEFYTLALQAVNDIDRRASYELLPDVMLVTGAVINSLQSNPSGQPCDGPMGISVALSPATNTVTMSKSMITNASFRTKKLPDDIPIQAGMPIPSESTDVLSSITEENENENVSVQRGTAVRNSKPKLPSFPGLGKKPKDKDKDSKDKNAPIKNGSTTTDILKKPQSITKDTIKGNSRSSLTGAGDVLDGTSTQKKNLNDIHGEQNGTVPEEKVSMVSDSLHNSIEGSDTHSQITADSLDIDVTVPRLTAMQVSSV